VHIGTGEQIEPFNYVIRDHTFYRIDLSGFLANLTEKTRNEFYRLNQKGDINVLRQFIAESVDLDEFTLYTAGVSETVETLYRNKISDINNQLLVTPFIHSEIDYRSYIPGSSIKGAIRTALISGIAKNKKFDKSDMKKFAQFFEGMALSYRDVKNDPFKAIKIRDAHLPEDARVVCEIYNMGRHKTARGSQFKSMQMFNEVTKSLLDEEIMEFVAEVIIDEELQNRARLSHKFTIEDIITACNAFYLDKMKMEDNKFYVGTPVEKASKMLLSQTCKENEFLLRVGRFSQVESVTVDEHRVPHTRFNPRTKRQMGWGNTRNICEKKYPCGWIKATVH
jgi:CRISPR type III-A-associated RAMP protein Csm5